jgi:hypothetical protein
MSPTPPLSAFTAKERRLIARLRTPEQVQRYFNRLPYNTDSRGGQDSLRSFRQMVRHGKAHCLEAALSAACILEQHGYPPLVMSLESADGLDHVIFIYRRRGRWGSVARSRDPGLHGRKPVFRTLRALTLSYFDEYVDATGSITGYGRFDLRQLGDKEDWRFSPKNLLGVERALIRTKHARIAPRLARVRRLRARYLAYLETHKKKPLFYRGRKNWTEIPGSFR